MEIFPQILLSGASGLIGTALRHSFDAQGVQYSMLVRDTPQPATSDIQWNPYATGTLADPQLDVRRMEGMRAAIHLSGDNLSSGRWTKAKKERIRTSRINTTDALVRILCRLHAPPEVLICASAIGFYGDRGDEILTEASSAGSGFLPDVCVAWEQAADAARQCRIRVVHLRLAVVLASGGGALAKLLPVFRVGLGGRLGNGCQWMSWISLPDVVRMIDRVLSDTSIAGPVNAVAPTPVTNREFTETLAHVLRRPALAAVPEFALHAALGEMADATLLASTRVVPARMQQTDFRFQHSSLESALYAATCKQSLTH